MSVCLFSRLMEMHLITPPARYLFFSLRPPHSHKEMEMWKVQQSVLNIKLFILFFFFATDQLELKMKRYKNVYDMGPLKCKYPWLSVHPYIVHPALCPWRRAWLSCAWWGFPSAWTCLGSTGIWTVCCLSGDACGPLGCASCWTLCHKAEKQRGDVQQ